MEENGDRNSAQSVLGVREALSEWAMRRGSRIQLHRIQGGDCRGKADAGVGKDARFGPARDVGPAPAVGTACAVPQRCRRQETPIVESETWAA